MALLQIIKHTHGVKADHICSFDDLFRIKLWKESLFLSRLELLGALRRALPSFPTRRESRKKFTLYHISVPPPPPDFLMCVMFHFLSFPPKEQTTRYPNHPSLCEPTTQSASEGTEEDIRQREVTEQAVCLCQLTLENYRPKMMNITYSLSLITFREWNEEESTHIWSAFPAMYTEAKDDTRTQPKWKNEADGPF